MATSAGRFEAFDAHVRHALQLAREASEHDGLADIGTEQLLLGLLGESRSVARRVLRSFGIQLETVQPLLQQLRNLSTERVNSELPAADSAEHVTALPVSGEVRLTPEAKRVLERGVDAARTLGHPSVGTEHLLLGLLDVRQGAAVDMLLQRGVDLDALRSRTVQVATRNPARSSRRVRVAGDVPHIGAVEGARWSPPLVAPTRNNVVMCRLDDAALEAIDTLIEAGVRTNRSDAAGWLINVGLESKAAVVEAVKDKVADIRRIREAARTLAENAEAQE